MVVGHVTKPHGVRGEVFVRSLTDHPDCTFEPGVVLHPAGEDQATPDPELPALEIERVRPYRRGWLVTFSGVEERNAAELLRGRHLLRPVEELEELAEDEFFYHELLEMWVVTADGRELGRVSEVYELRPAHLLEVRGEEGTVLIPFIRENVVELDREGKRLVLDPPEGLLEL